MTDVRGRGAPQRRRPGDGCTRPAPDGGGSSPWRPGAEVPRRSAVAAAPDGRPRPRCQGPTRVPDLRPSAAGPRPDSAFGLRSGHAPDRHLLGLAALTLFAGVADERPPVRVVDDAQWLDQASAETLEFVARRLAAEPVAMVVAARETPAPSGSPGCRSSRCGSSLPSTRRPSWRPR